MKHDRQEFSAPWGRLLTGMSSGVIVLFATIAVAGRATAILIVLGSLIFVLALPFIIRGYAISEGMLIIKRLGWEKNFQWTTFRQWKPIPMP